MQEKVSMLIFTMLLVTYSSAYCVLNMFQYMRAAVYDELAQQIFKLYKSISQKIVCSSAY